MVSRHEDVRSVLMDRKAFGQGDGVSNIRLFYGPDFDVLGHPSYGWLSDVFLMQDPPRHTRVRGLVTGALNARLVRAMEPRIAAIADELIDNIIQAGHADLIQSFAYQLPVRVMCDMLGVDPQPPSSARRYSCDCTKLHCFRGTVSFRHRTGNCEPRNSGSSSIF